MLSTAVQHYKQYGYYIGRNLLSHELLLDTLFEMDIILVQQLNLLGMMLKPSRSLEMVYDHMRILYKKNIDSYLQSLRLWPKLFSMQALVMHENIAKVIKELNLSLPIFQTAPVVHVMSNDLNIPGGYHGVGVHQDWPALQSGLDTITIWFPFMEVDVNNFPVELIPGSHVQGLYPGQISSHIYEVDSTCYKEEDFIPMELKMGDVFFMSNFTLHRSGKQGNKLRIACSARYENATEKTFIERSYPSAQKRVIERKLMKENFPKKEDLQNLWR